MRDACAIDDARNAGRAGIFASTETSV